MNKKFYPPVIMAFCAAWWWAMWSPTIASESRVGLVIVVVLATASFAAVRHIHRECVEIGLASAMLCVGTLALMMFTVWSSFITGIFLPVLPESIPAGLRFSTLFLSGLLAVAATAVLFVYPLAVLLPRFHWLAPVLAAGSVAIIQYESIIDQTTRPLTRSLMLFELGCLAVGVPLIVALFVGRIRRGATGGQILGSLRLG